MVIGDYLEYLRKTDREREDKMAYRVRKIKVETELNGPSTMYEKKSRRAPRIKVSSAKAKGRALQDYMCQMVSDLIGIPWGRGDEDLIQPRQMGQTGLDVILHGEAFQKFPFSVECKSSESWALPAAIRQVRKSQRKESHWLVVLKRKEFQKPVIVMDAEAFKFLCEGLLRHNEDGSEEVGVDKE